MATALPASTPSRRVTIPHHHLQPKYPDPETQQRRPASGTQLHKVHSRPEDYKNKPRPSNLVEYICFDGQNRPVDCNERQPSNDEFNRRNHDSSPTGDRGSDSDTGYDDDDEDDSEEELDLPTHYHSRPGRHESRSEHHSPKRHSSAQPHPQPSQHRRPQPDTDEYTSQPSPVQHSHHLSPPEHRRPSNHQDGRRNSWHGPAGPANERFDISPMTRHNTYNHADSNYDSRSHHRSRQDADHHESSSSGVGAKVVSEIAHHLQSHKAAYSNNHDNRSELVNQLVSQVMRKVADGSLNGDMIKDVLREVQHVL